MEPNPNPAGQGFELALRVVPMPSDANFDGDIFGGWIMAQVDLAGAIVAKRAARGRCATVAVEDFVFKQAVSVGDLLSFHARLERVGTTSATVRVEVFAERRPEDPVVVKVTEAALTYVALDSAGRPRPIERPGQPVGPGEGPKGFEQPVAAAAERPSEPESAAPASPSIQAAQSAARHAASPPAEPLAWPDLPIHAAVGEAAADPARGRGFAASASLAARAPFPSLPSLPSEHPWPWPGACGEAAPGGSR